MNEAGCTLLDAVLFTFLSDSILRNDYFRIRISDGRYSNNSKIMNEIQNRMNEAVTQRCANMIFGTSRFRPWGDHLYKLMYFPNRAVQTDASPVATSDRYGIYYYVGYSSSAVTQTGDDDTAVEFEAALNAFRFKYPQYADLQPPTESDLANGTQTSYPFTAQTLNELVAQTASPADPPILMASKVSYR